MTLGISTNTRLISYAVIFQGQLVDYATHLHKASWSPHKVGVIVASLAPCVRKHRITKVVLSIPYAHHQTNEHKSLIEALRSFFIEQAIAVYTQTPEAFTAFHKEGQKKNKKSLMKTMAGHFPELRQCYEKELRNKNKYYFKLFEAVALATLTEQCP